MASLFQGSPQTATSYSTSTSETPKWMQDAIYNQIQWATNIAQQPYQKYTLDTVAPLSEMQKQAYGNVEANQNAWQPNMNAATGTMTGLLSAETASGLKKDQNQYLRQGLVDQNLNAGQNYFNQAGQQDMVGAASPYLNQAATSAQNITGAANPYLNQAGTTTAQALSDRALSAANPYLQAASQSSAANVGQYMSPYQQNAMDVLAKQGARNLSENLLPQVSDAFIKAGQFGGTRMGEFGNRALRDTQEAILNQQATMANQGYGQALGASSADLARQAQLAGTVGSISGADLSRVLQGGAQYGNLAQTAGGLNAQQASSLANIGQTTGQLTGQQMQNLSNLGQMQTTAGQAQQQFGLTAAQAAQQAQAQDYARQMQAATGLGALTQQQNAMRSGDIASLEAAGAAQQGQAQKVLSAAQQEFQNEQAYPKSQLDWLNTQVRGMAPITPTTTTNQGTTTGATYTASPLAQLASGLAMYKGLSNLG